MDITRYTFQSPYSSQIQIGKPDVITLKSGAELPKSTNESLQKAESFKTTQIQEVTPKVDPKTPLDVYV
jgi:hypothetical protein